MCDCYLEVDSECFSGAPVLINLSLVPKQTQVKGILETSPTDFIERRGENGDTLLHLAARNGHKTIIKELLRRKADFQGRNDDGKQPHELAFKFNHTELCEYIREKARGAGQPLSTPVASPGPGNGGDTHRTDDDSDDGDFILESMGLGDTPRGGADGGGPKHHHHHHHHQQQRQHDAIAVSKRIDEHPQKIREDGAFGSLPSLEGGGGAVAPAFKSAATPSRSQAGSRLSDVGATVHNEGGGGRLDNEGGGGRHLAQVEALLEVLWPRYAVLSASGEDIDENRQLQIEMNSLKSRLGEGGVEKLVDDRSRLERAREEGQAREQALKDEVRRMIKEAGEVKEELRVAKADAEERRRLAEREERERVQREAREAEHVERREELERELREARRERDTANRRLESMERDLEGVKSARVPGLSPTEFEAALSSQRGGGGGGDVDGSLASSDVRGFVEEIASQLSKKISEGKEEVKRLKERMERGEAESERERETAKERERDMQGSIKRLEREVEEGEERRKKETNELRERGERAAQLAEQRHARTVSDKDGEIAKAKRDGEEEMKRLEKRLGDAAELERRTHQEALDWNKKLLEQSSAEIKVLKEEKDKVTDRMQNLQLQLRDAKKEGDRLEREAKASKAQSTIQALAGFRTSLISTRQALRDLRSEQESQMEEANGFFAQMSSEITSYCSFIAPMTFQRPEQLHTDRLTPEQLAKGLKHMVAKYRTTSEMCRELNVEVQNLKGSMRVMCRVRPLKRSEEAEGTVVAFREEGVISIHDKTGPKDFQFDTTFGPNHGQVEVFKEASPLLETVADGFNVSVFAYGPTGSGKTYTMTGDKDSANQGLTYRVLSELFRIQKERAVVVEQQVYLSMFEIYNEQIKDLLPSSGAAGIGLGSAAAAAAAGSVGATAGGGGAAGTRAGATKGGGDGENAGGEGGVRITMDKKGRVTLEGLNELKCDTLQKGTALVQHGLRSRAVAATNMNEHSSRSHLLIRLTVRSVDRHDGTRKVGKMYLIDLAGSENVSQSGAEGKHLKEAIMINKSLSALHDVMSALSSNSSHIPYRNSTLTKVLTDSLGGSAKCLMYVMVSPAALERSATLSALAFAARCKDIVLQPAKQNVGKVAIEELEAAKRSEDKAKQEAEERGRMYDELVEKTEVSRKVNSECERFEEKLRELFNFEPLAKRKKNGPGGSKASHLQGVEAQYLSEPQRLIVRKQHVHDELITRIRREIETLGYTVREQNTKLTRAQASNTELAKRLDMERNRAAQMQNQMRRSREELEEDEERYFSEQGVGGGGSPPLRPVMAWDPSVKPKPVPLLFPPVPKNASAADRLEAKIAHAREARAEARALSVPSSKKQQVAQAKPLPFIGGGLG